MQNNNQTNVNVNVNANPTEAAKPVVLVSVDELRDMLLQRQGTAFASVDSRTDMLELDAKGAPKRMNKRGNPFLGQELYKVATYNVQINFDYDAAMQRRTDGAESAKNNGNTWQQRVNINGKATPLTVHKGDVREYDDDGNPTSLARNARAYLACEYRSNETRYVDGKGNSIDAETVKPYLKKKSERGPVAWMTLPLNTMTEMRIDGKIYRVRR